ncbi:MAG TPA: antibiotic biosynthesis monooxygenase [Bradyrhizobium sp.]|uniref:putative quinol monooxygenase n=1 Tax=Bradyrhizobium sp. TaxID=376 RepID=UPI002D7F7DB9|nr:antibiotic biosynthesis monooxygenase [Bradyrhizobium sp.]HET7889444.1 antibiotic biosynthesis monooxygenase [Bradyrhizobium sp.]
MYRPFLAAVIAMAGLVAVGSVARAQTPPPAPDPSQPATIVVYTEVAPAKAAEAKKLILAYVAAARKADGAVQIDVGQRISDPGHFGIVEQWKSLAAKQAFAQTDAYKKYRAALDPLRSAAYDERIHNALSVGASKPASSGAILVLTHVDVVPTQVEPGTAKVKAFVEEGRNAPGNLRFDDVVQANRKNHFTVIETWKSQGEKNNWISSKTVRTFREELQPMGGALYDERVFKVL